MVILLTIVIQVGSLSLAHLVGQWINYDGNIG